MIQKNGVAKCQSGPGDINLTSSLDIQTKTPTHSSVNNQLQKQFRILAVRLKIKTRQKIRFAKLL